MIVGNEFLEGKWYVIQDVLQCVLCLLYLDFVQIVAIFFQGRRSCLAIVFCLLVSVNKASFV